MAAAPPPKTDLAKRVEGQMDKLGLSQAEVARRGRFNAVFVSDVVRGKKHRLHPGNWPRLARSLGTTIAYLRFGLEPTQEELFGLLADGWLPREKADPALVAAFDAVVEADFKALPPLGSPPSAETSLRYKSEKANIPLFRSGGRSDGAVVVTDPPMETLPSKPASSLYAVAISDTSMAPRFEPGDCAYALSHSAANPKDYVVLQLRGRSRGQWVTTALVRQLVRNTPHEVVVRQLAPSIETIYQRSSVVAVDRIVLAGEPFGDRSS